jgi:hypothetical protein
MDIPWSYIISLYIFLNFAFSLRVYFNSKRFYVPYYVTENGKTFDIHSKYPEFSKHDSISWLRIFLGLNLLVWFKFILLILACISCTIFLK